MVGGAGSEACGFSSQGNGYSCSMACGILVSEPGFELMPFALQGGFLNTGPPGKFLDVTVEFYYVLPDFLPDDLSISNRQVLKSPIQIAGLPMSFATLLSCPSHRLSIIGFIHMKDCYVFLIINPFIII